jgi:hypothetical protein
MLAFHISDQHINSTKLVVAGIPDEVRLPSDERHKKYQTPWRKDLIRNAIGIPVIFHQNDNLMKV